MAPKARARPSLALEGEDLKTSRWEDARHWMSIYADLLEFKRGILDRVRRAGSPSLLSACSGL
jgi:hypothetical protein